MPDILATLDAIQARADAATAGPWTVDQDSFPRMVGSIAEPWTDDYGTPYPSFVANVGSFYNSAEESRVVGNGDFIAHARTDIPRLCAALRLALTWPADAAKYGEDWVAAEARETLAAIDAALEGKQ